MKTGQPHAFAHLRDSLLKQHENLTKMAASFTSPDFTDKLRNILYEENKEEEKNGNVKKMKARIILTKQGEVVFKFDDAKNGRVFFDTIK